MTIIGTIELIAKIDTTQYKKGESDIKSSNRNIEGSLDSVDNKSSKATLGLSRLAKAGLAAVATAGVAAGAAIVSNFDNAIKRVDTLNNSTRTFANMGFRAKDVSVAMDGLQKSILGLPTSLDEAVRGVQMIAASTNDVKKSQRIFEALNNGILGFGGTSEQVSNAVQQLSQDLAGGRIQAETWNSLLDSGLGPTLAAIARQMGLTTRELKEGLGEGKISTDEFTKSLVRMNEKGGGGMKSLQQIAKDSTNGITSGWANLNIAITRGIASIIEAIGSENISNAITNFGKGFEAVLKSIPALMTQVGNLARQVGDYLGPKFTALWNTISTQLLPALNNLWHSVIEPIIPVIGTTLVVAFGLAVDAVNRLIKVISPLINWLGQNKEAVWGVIGAITAWYTIMKVTSAFNTLYNSIAITRARLFALTTQIGTTRNAFTLLNRALSTPITLSIFVGAALIAIQKVYDAAQKTLKVFDELNDSRDSLSKSTTDAMQRSQKLLREARARGDKKSEERILRSMRAIAGASSGFASGGFTGRGPSEEIAGIVHRGEFVIPKEFVDQNTGLPQMPTQKTDYPKITVKLSHSPAMMRQAALDTIELVNQVYRAKGLPEIGVA